MRLTKAERETIVLFNEAEDTASIYTCNTALKKRLADFAEKYSALCRLEKMNDEGGITYILDKSRLSIRFIAPYSEERRQQAREHAMKHSFGGQTE